MAQRKRRPAIFPVRPGTASNILWVKSALMTHTSTDIRIARKSPSRYQFDRKIEQSKCHVHTNNTAAKVLIFHEKRKYFLWKMTVYCTFYRF